jgi:DNA-binding transcriptional LysR family regulator
MTLRAPVALFAFAFVSGCASTPQSPPPTAVPQTFSQAAFAEHECIGRLKDSLAALAAPRMDSFFSAALNGLLRCEATSGLAHVPTRDINGWLAHANGKPVATKIPPAPRMLAQVPRDDPARLPYQRACVAYLRRYLPASIARAGDDADVAAAFAFNALEECDNTAGFATIEPNELATMMQSKHLL